MICINFVAAVSSNKQQVQIRLGQQILDQVECCGVIPLQIIEEEHQWMGSPGEHANKATKHELETDLRLTGWKLSNRGLLADNQAQIGDQFDDQPSIPSERLPERLPPGREFALTFAEKRTHKALKGLH
ncbi:hypothetical protein ACVWWI_006404 [Bradyrhizobium sp. USDA 3686]